jgi:hypothetical protein
MELLGMGCAKWDQIRLLLFVFTFLANSGLDPICFPCASNQRHANEQAGFNILKMAVCCWLAL